MTTANKKPFIAGNWKLNKTVSEALEFVTSLKEACLGITGAEIVAIPPYTALYPMSSLIKDSPIKLGAQNFFWEDSGAYTGEISVDMLLDVGCSYGVIGHSERRQYFGETNETVNKKIQAALSHRLTPIFCMGESLQERESGKTMEKIESQILEGLEDIGAEDFRKIVFAYEPIWAIGTGLTATPDQAEDVHRFIRNILAEKYGNDLSSCAIILYGGSVKPDNTFSLLSEKDINGALVGGASLKADSFAEIIKEGIRAYKEK
ncbi:MAG: triose-phosphate isomerase [Candidatus Aminicenantes bacterium]|nr:triose-phosphate isomerase [Candidatus Aminicenantes bacterium]